MSSPKSYKTNHKKICILKFQVLVTSVQALGKRRRINHHFDFSFRWKKQLTQLIKLNLLII